MAPATISNARPSLDTSGRSSRQDDAIVEAAWCYYHDGMNQMEIAKRLGVSRASVVNYLAEARRRDYVRVTLDTGIFHNHRLVHDIKTMFGLSEALIVPDNPSDDQRTAERVVRVASDWLPQLLEPGDHLGVAWGDTIYRLAEMAPKLQLQDLTIVQLLGSRTGEIGSASENCAATLADRLGAHCANLHVPLTLSSTQLAEALRAEPSIARHLRLIDECRKVIFASGTFEPGSHVERVGLVSPENMAAMRAQGATGVICGRVIDQDGVPLVAPNEDKMIGISLDAMRAKDMGILVSSGADRLNATHAALRGGYATHLVTSSRTAEGLLRLGP